LWAVLHNHQQIESVSKDGTITFYNSSQIQGQQANAEQQLQTLRQQAQANGSTGNQPGVSIAGNWNGTNGLAYVIQQFGAAIVVQEFCSCGGITAVGNGSFDGTNAQVQYQAIDGSTGQARFTLTGDAVMVAQFHNDTYNTTSPQITLDRQN
jgi:hypothetical protein